MEGGVSLVHSSQSPAGDVVEAGGSFMRNLPRVEYGGQYPSLDECVLNIDKPFARVLPTSPYLDAGASLHLRRGDGRSLSLPKDAGWGSYGASADLAYYVSGQSYSFSGPGGADVGPFQTPSLIAPPPLYLHSPKPAPGALPPFVYHETSKPLNLVWNGNSGKGAVEFVISDVSASQAYTLICLFVDDGGGQIPASLLTQMRNGLLANPGPLASSLLFATRRNHARFELPGLVLDASITAVAGTAIKLK